MMNEITEVKNDNDDDNEDEIVEETLQQRQPTEEEKEDFKNKMTEWLKIDEQIKKLAIAIRERKRLQNVLNTYIKDFMYKYNYEDVNINNCKVRARKKESLKPLKVVDIKNKMLEYKDMNGEQLVEKIFDPTNREKYFKDSLTRVMPRIRNLTL